MDCRDASKFMALRVDGEIDESDCADLEQHLQDCPFCQQRWEAERFAQEQIKDKLKISLSGANHEASEALRQRIMSHGRAEAAVARRPLVFGLPVAACVALAVVAVVVPQNSKNSGSDNVVHQMTDHAVQRHSANLPSEVVIEDDARPLEAFFSQHLSFPVHVPNERTGPRLVGARLSHIDRSNVAYIMYDHRGAKVSLFAFPRGRGLSSVTGHSLVRREDHLGRPIFVGRERGYNVVSWSAPEADYALVSELDVGEMVSWSNRVRSIRPRRDIVREPMPRFERESPVRTVSHRR